MKVAIGSDISGLELKLVVIEHLRDAGFEVIECGYDPELEADAEYSATYGSRVARMIRDGEADRGVLVCGTGVGISISANKVRGIRACVCSEPFTARHTRQYNGTQIIAFGAFVVGPEMATRIVDEFLGATFLGESDPEYVERFKKIERIEIEEAELGWTSASDA